MAHVRAVGVPMLVHQPFPLGGVGMACANVFGLQVLKLTVDVVAISHSGKCVSEKEKKVMLLTVQAIP